MRLRSMISDPMARLWAFVILAGIVVLGILRPLPPNDLWWHARVGVDILETGRIPRSDVYSLTIDRKSVV